MGWIQLAVLAFQLIIKIFDVFREKNIEKKRLQTEQLQRGLRGVVDHDTSRITASLAELNRLRK